MVTSESAPRTTAGIDESLAATVAEGTDIEGTAGEEVNRGAVAERRVILTPYFSKIKGSSSASEQGPRRLAEPDSAAHSNSPSRSRAGCVSCSAAASSCDRIWSEVV